MFKKIMVANRGEIAKRIFTACRELGVTSVAIYSDADAGSQWIMSADEAYPLSGTTASESYLDQAKVIAIAQANGVEAIHPGYGFLSENAGFAEACATAGIKFIGPSPAAMRLMGSKASAREVAQAAGVPVTPGVDGAGKSSAELQQAADEIGYPVLIKASAGGGGKGMRVVEAAGDFLGALQSARSEAANSFGDDHIILEKYFTKIHHIEIQILGDEHGNVRHLFERECSIQRRHQKIIEETPSPTIPDSVRQVIASAAVKLAQSAGYASAGTVEFMYTGDGNFYLLEMNTRLQVEHPITEWVTGHDLAQWQIKIAAGMVLDVAQDAISQRGHAIECRVYAEDPAQNFLPSIATATLVEFPVMPNVRTDAGIATGEAVTPYYDPMLAKVIVFGSTRAEAIDRMILALKQTIILGLTTNIPYMLDILQEEDFRKGETTTNYLAEHFDGWKPSLTLTEDDLLAIAAVELLSTGQKTAAGSGEAKQSFDPWNEPTAWRNR
ncbi:MAG: 3-methylcrotonyl-CoA carboxylase alpha subunit [Candidatus Promineifilaceae bacterium]|jgi:3-methylcrotonyl-CoA carboxylase alpha subunit